MSVSCKISVQRDNWGGGITRSGHKTNADFFALKKSASLLKHLGLSRNPIGFRLFDVWSAPGKSQ
jgi:hypothetical protein